MFRVRASAPSSSAAAGADRGAGSSSATRITVQPSSCTFAWQLRHNVVESRTDVTPPSAHPGAWCGSSWVLRPQPGNVHPPSRARIAVR